MKTFTADEFKKKFGEDMYNSFPTTKPTQTGNQPSYASPSYASRLTDNVSSDLNTRVDRVSNILGSDRGAVTKGVQVFGQGVGLAANTLEQTVGQAPIVPFMKNSPTVGDAVNATAGAGIKWLTTSEYSPVKHLGEFIGRNKALQTAVQLYDTDADFRDSLDAVANIVRLGGDVQLGMDAANITNNVTRKIMSKATAKPVPPAGGGGMTVTAEAVRTAPRSTTGAITKDIVPTSERIVNHELTKAFDLTQGDVKNIKLSTGNEVGEWVAKENLIGNTIEETTKNITDFKNTNYTAVRAEIKNVKGLFDKNIVPAVKESLTEIKKQITGKVGLTKVETEVDGLLSKTKYTLEEIQRTKELMDDHFNLYKQTGDVGEGVVKTGLANIRKELQTFIEDTVEKSTGADIRALNNNVQTAREILDAIETRSTRGLTRATISAGDVVTFLTGTGAGLGNPLVGVAAVIAKKIYQSPSFKLKFSKWLDGMNDTKRAKVFEDLKAGKAPEGIKVQSSPKKSSSESKTEKTATTNRANVSATQSNIELSIPQKGTQSKPLKSGDLSSKNSSIAEKIKKWWKNMPNKEGGFVRIGKKEVKQIPEETKKEMITLLDYINKDTKFDPDTFSPKMEKVFDDITSKYGINPNWSNAKISDTLEKLIENTKTS